MQSRCFDGDFYLSSSLIRRQIPTSSIVADISAAIRLGTFVCPNDLGVLEGEGFSRQALRCHIGLHAADDGIGELDRQVVGAYGGDLGFRADRSVNAFGYTPG